MLHSTRNNMPSWRDLQNMAIVAWSMTPKVHHFLQGIKGSELEAVVNVVWAKQEKYGTDYDAIISYLGQKVMKKSVQSIHSGGTRGQPVKPKVATFMGKIKCKKYPKAVWNSMTKNNRCR